MSQFTGEVSLSPPNEDALAAEAIEVVRHALERSRRGGKGGRRGRQPSMHYSAIRSRNPRKCLEAASRDLGFKNRAQAEDWIKQQPYDWSNKLNLRIRPRPQNIENFETGIEGPSVLLEYPTRLKGFFSYLDEEDLADLRPIVFGIKDARGEKERLMMKVISDPRPKDKDKLVLTGRLLMRKGRVVHCLDGSTHAIFPGHFARIHMIPDQDIHHVEFLDVLPSD